MARVTIEDCIDTVPNRFELVHLAVRRTKQLLTGSPLLVDDRNNKEIVMSLREIAESQVTFENFPQYDTEKTSPDAARRKAEAIFSKEEDRVANVDLSEDGDEDGLEDELIADPSELDGVSEVEEGKEGKESRSEDEEDL
jgi:DNA-directed RNA polymerase subunit omega